MDERVHDTAWLFMQATLISLTICSAVAAQDAPVEPAGGAAPQPLALHPDYVVHDDDPEAHVPTPAQANANPLQFGYFLMDAADKGDRATARGDHARALKYYGALAKAVPDRAVSFSKLCSAYQALGDNARALEACAAALGLGGVKVDDFAHYVHLVIAIKGELPSAQVARAKEAVRHLIDDPKATVAGSQLQCELALRLRDGASLSECVAALGKAAPKDPKTLAFSWALAIDRGDLAQAGQIVRAAKSSGMGAAGVEKMERGLAQAELASSAASPWWQRVLRSWISLVSLLALALVLTPLALRRLKSPTA